MSTLTRLSLALVFALLGACQSSWYPYRFVPAPLEVRLDAPNDAEAQGRALITVLGVHRADAKHGRALARVEIRMRLENAGQKPMKVEPESFSLVAATLESFGRAEFSDLPKDPIAKGQSAVFEIYFALPDGKSPDDIGFNGLNLKWDVSFDGVRVGTGVSFERAREPYWDPGWYGDPFYEPFCVHTHFAIVGHAHDD